MRQTQTTEPQTMYFAEWSDQEMQDFIDASPQQQKAMLAAKYPQKYQAPQPKRTAKIHSFSTKQCKNHNVIITFYEGAKQRHIHLSNGTEAHKLYVLNFNQYSQVSGMDVATRTSLENLRLDFNFKSMDNAPSIFYPKAKR